MRFLAARQKQLRVNVYEKLRQISANDAIFLPRVITGDESWIYGYDLESEQQSFRWKNLNSPRAKKEVQVTSGKLKNAVFWDVTP
jgi:hypothetical protein